MKECGARPTGPGTVRTRRMTVASHSCQADRLAYPVHSLMFRGSVRVLAARGKRR
jgi:hypothetical protein